jgi:hypothetical protein
VRDVTISNNGGLQADSRLCSRDDSRSVVVRIVRARPQATDRGWVRCAEHATLTWVRAGLGGPHCVLREHQLRVGLRRTDLVVVTHSYAHAWLLGYDASCFETLPKALEGLELVTLVVPPADAPALLESLPSTWGLSTVEPSPGSPLVMVRTPDHRSVNGLEPFVKLLGRDQIGSALGSLGEPVKFTACRGELLALLRAQSPVERQRLAVMGQLVSGCCTPYVP